MLTTVFPTPPLGQWMQDHREAFERSRAANLTNGLALKLGALESWAREADAELQQLRHANANLERDLAEAIATLEALPVAGDFDAETARPIRGGTFADDCDIADGVAAAFMPDPVFGRHAHE